MVLLGGLEISCVRKNGNGTCEKNDCAPHAPMTAEQLCLVNRIHVPHKKTPPDFASGVTWREPGLFVPELFVLSVPEGATQQSATQGPNRRAFRGLAAFVVTDHTS